MTRNLALGSRIEDVRNPQELQVVQFDLNEIKGHFDQSMAAIKQQFLITDELLANGKLDECKAIWRSQIVFLEGVLDFYIHEISKYGLYQMFKGNWSKTEKYKSFFVPMKEVERAISAGESKEWFFEYINTKFSRDVFLAAETMKDKLNLIGVGFGPVMEIAFPKGTVNESHAYGKEIVQKLFERRNAIAHQVDRSHASEEQNDIDKTYVEQCIADVEAIVTASQQRSVLLG